MVWDVRDIKNATIVDFDRFYHRKLNRLCRKDERHYFVFKVGISLESPFNICRSGCIQNLLILKIVSYARDKRFFLSL